MVVLLRRGEGGRFRDTHKIPNTNTNANVNQFDSLAVSTYTPALGGSGDIRRWG